MVQNFVWGLKINDFYIIRAGEWHWKDNMLMLTILMKVVIMMTRVVLMMMRVLAVICAVFNTSSFFCSTRCYSENLHKTILGNKAGNTRLSHFLNDHWSLEEKLDLGFEKLAFVIWRYRFFDSRFLQSNSYLAIPVLIWTNCHQIIERKSDQILFLPSAFTYCDHKCEFCWNLL